MKTYPISTLRDIFNLPTAEKMAECLAELTKCMIHARSVSDAMTAFGKSRGVECERACEWPESVDWIDDGKGDLKTSVTDPDGNLLFTLKVPAAQ